MIGEVQGRPELPQSRVGSPHFGDGHLPTFRCPFAFSMQHDWAMAPELDPYDFCGTDEDPRFTRRHILSVLGVAGVVLLGGGTSAAVAATKTKTKTKTKTSNGACVVVPAETGGPFPGDGSNGVNVLTQPGVVRSDIRSSFGSSTQQSAGALTRVELTVTSAAKKCAPLVGAAVYAWHCDVDGNYSMYSDGVTEENFLRGVQPTNQLGTATFTTVFPGAYPGRWPHIHFEVYPSLAKATTSKNKIATSQLALPDKGCQEVYALDGYEASREFFEPGGLSRDGVFRDGAALQMATMTGNAKDGFVVKLTVAI